MKIRFARVLLLLAPLAPWPAVSTEAFAADVKAWEGTITIPTYPWQDDVNPKFWALESGSKLSTTIQGAIVYPYVMQDHLSRKKVDRTYKALFLENEYLKVTCLPELGGRLHSVLDKTQGKEMFHANRVIKPGMIAMRGAWISGGVEWNSGPHGHTVTILSPVDALTGRNEDGSAYLEISNQEQIFRTRWTIRVTLHPGRAFLEERIRLANPTDGMHPYYFWNCTAFPNRPGTRFIYPMTLGTDHNAREFFRWPIDKGIDLSWLKNYPTYQSIFSVKCTYDFFGAYDVEADRGIVQVANHHELGGKKAWTWGEWEFGKVAQKNLTDEDGPYIEVQSGPLPTQSDYGMLGPRDQVAWREWWFPVHGLGDGFEYATKDLAAQTSRRGGRLEVRLLATGRFPKAVCVLSRADRELVRKELDLAPGAPAVVALAEDAQKPVDVRVTTSEGQLLAAFTTPLPIPKVEPPDPAKFHQKPDAQLSAEELYMKGRAYDRGTERLQAREYYEKALARDPGHAASLRSLAVLDFEAGLYRQAIARLDKALDRDGDDGLSWFYRGASCLRLGDFPEAQRCGYRAVRCPGTASIGYDLVGRAAMRLGNKPAAVIAFQKAARLNPDDPAAADHLMIAMDAAANMDGATSLADRRMEENPTTLVPRALPALRSEQSLAWFAKQARGVLGERDFELLEASLVFAELGLMDEAGRLVKAACVDVVPPAERSFLPLYYLAWYAAQRGDKPGAGKWLEQAAATHKDRVFASRPEEVEILQYAVRENPGDAQAHLQLGCLLANLGRVADAVDAWQRAADLTEEGRGEKGSREHRLAQPGTRDVREGRFGQGRGLLPQGDLRAARRPDTLPRPGRDSRGCQQAARGHPALGDDAAGGRAARGDHGHARSGLRRREALGRLHQAPGIDAVLRQLGRAGHHLAPVQPGAHRTGPAVARQGRRQGRLGRVRRGPHLSGQPERGPLEQARRGRGPFLARPGPGRHGPRRLADRRRRRRRAGRAKRVPPEVPRSARRRETNRCGKEVVGTLRVPKCRTRSVRSTSLAAKKRQTPPRSVRRGYRGEPTNVYAIKP